MFVRRSRRAMKKRRDTLLEALESRQMLAVLTGSGEIPYLDNEGNGALLVYNDVTVEFLWVSVDPDSGAVTVRETPVAIDSTDPGADLYAIWVSEATLDSSIIVGEILVDPGTDPNPMTPFGSAISINVNSAQGEGIITVNGPDNGGVLILGALTQGNDDENQNDRPIMSVNNPFASGTHLFPLQGDSPTLAPGLTVFNSDAAPTDPQPDLGKFLFGGTVTGNVFYGGSADMFYAGWLLTGATGGQSVNGSPAIPQNFVVNGDIRNLLTNGSIGTDTDEALDEPDYVTGFDLVVGGNIGQIATKDSFIGAFNVANSPDAAEITAAQTEIEDRRAPLVNTSNSYFQQGTLGESRDWDNDTFNTAQYLGVINHPEDFPGTVNVVQLEGVLNHGFNENDSVDYYAVNLMAGQTYAVQLTPSEDATGAINVGVFDPYERLIATDYNSVISAAVRNQAFQFTADRPGTYYFAVTFNSNSGFAADASITGNVTSGYTLGITGVGNLAVGGLVATNNIFDYGKSNAYQVAAGDLGGIVSTGGTILSSVVADEENATINVTTGNLRTLQAQNIGIGGGTAPANGGVVLTNGVSVIVAQKSVGLVRTLDEEGQLLFRSAAPIGLDLQWLESAGNFGGSVITNRNIGVIRADHISTAPPPVITVNAGNDPNIHGTIDMIWTRGQMGTLSTGGPQITTGTGGNVRYMWAGGPVFRDIFFGGGTPDDTLHAAGEQVRIVDDSGSVLWFTPLGEVTNNPAYNPSVPGSQEKLGPQLSIITYGIRGSGGSVVMKVKTAGTNPQGVNISSSGTSNAPTAEIGEIAIRGQGTAPLVNSNGTLSRVNSSGSIILPRLNIMIDGSAIVDVYNITCMDPLEVVNENFDVIRNNTKGEIVRLEAATINTFTSAGTIGLAKSTTGAAVQGMDNIVGGDTYPFVQQKNGLVLTGVGAIMIHSGRGLGNFINANPTASARFQQITANADGVNEDGIFAGINGPIVATAVPPEEDASIGTVNIGQGMLPTGTGAVGFSGLFAKSYLEVVNGANADIMGDIVVQHTPLVPAVAGGTVRPAIGEINLTNGSITNANILVVEDFEMAREYTSGYVAPHTTGSVTTNPAYEIGSVNIRGNGGIIGSLFAAPNIGPITNSGYGIISSAFLMLGDGKQAMMNVAGYGVRNSLFRGGSNFGGIVLPGDGGQLPVTNYSMTVRQSEVAGQVFDPYTNRMPDILSDIDVIFGVQSGQTTSDYTDAGILADTTMVGARNVNQIIAQQIRATDPDDLEVAELFFDSKINVANSINLVQTRSDIDGLELTTGTISDFLPGANVANLNMTVAGLIRNVVLTGAFEDTSSIRAIGPQGKLNRFLAKDTWAGVLQVAGMAEQIEFWGTMSGTLQIDNVDGPSRSLSRLLSSGEIVGGTITIKGNVDRILAQLGFGDADSTITINGDVNAIRIGIDKVANGADMGANLHVTGNLGHYEITGRQSGTLTVDGSLNNLYILADSAASGQTVVGGNIVISGVAGAMQILRGNIAANISAMGGFSSLTLSNGNVNATSTISSSAKGINSILVQTGNFYGTIANTGGFFGNLNFPAGGIGSLTAVRLGDGSLAPETINALTIGSLNVTGGSILGPLVVEYNSMNTLSVTGNIASSVSFNGAISTVRVGGTNAGNFDPPLASPAPALSAQLPPIVQPIV